MLSSFCESLHDTCGASRDEGVDGLPQPSSSQILNKRLYLWKLSPYGLAMFTIWLITSPQPRTFKFQVWWADLPPLNSSQSSDLFLDVPPFLSCPAKGHQLFIKQIRSDRGEWLQSTMQVMLHKNNSTKVRTALCTLLIQRSTSEYYKDSLYTVPTIIPTLGQCRAESPRWATWGWTVTSFPVSELDLYF